MSFYKLPKELFSNEKYKDLSSDAKLLYAFLADRTSLSEKNGVKWMSPNGKYFVFYTQREVMERLRCGHDKATKLFCELEAVNLIERAVQGVGKTYRIVVNNAFVDAEN